METLSFLLVIAFCAAVLFWYTTNLNAGSAGEYGLLGVVRNRIEATQNAIRSYRKKTRILPNSQSKVDAFAKRHKVDFDEPTIKPASLSADLHAMRKVTLKDADGMEINTQELANKARPVRYATRKKNTLKKRLNDSAISANRERETSSAQPRFRYKSQ